MVEKLKDLNNEIKDELIEIRKYLHQNPEVGFDLDKTYFYVFNKLKEYGYTPKKCGKCGIIADIGKTGGKAILLRADMDALPIKEEADIDYKSNNNNMHACGHDIHTTMLLGAAKILKSIENELNGLIRLMFQPAEEILEGAKDMIDNNLLDDPKIDAAVMIHISTGTNLKTSSIIVAPSGVSAPSSDHFSIEIKGSSSHGAMPELGVDPIYPSSVILQAIQLITSKEISMNDNCLINVTSIDALSTTNASPNKLTLLGTIRTYNEDVRSYIKKRIDEIVKNISNAFRIESKVNYLSSCPTLINDKSLHDFITSVLREDLNNYYIDISKLNMKNTASEDFSYISHLIPTVLISISAGSIEEGYEYPIHHPASKFNNEVLSIGSIVYSLIAHKYVKNV